MSLGDSILQTASIARCVSVVVTATDHTIFSPSVQDPDIRLISGLEDADLVRAGRRILFASFAKMMRHVRGRSGQLAALDER
jgi:hypothetical protein